MSSAAPPDALAPTPEAPAAAPAALSSSPTTDVVTERPSPPPPHPEQRPRDPKISQLKALFPDLEDSVLEAVLEGTAGSLDEATEQLLMMSDPDFKTDTTQLSQLEADEELARQLAREDELEQAQQRINAPHRSARSSTGQQHQQHAPSQPRPLSYQPYVPKSRRSTSGGGGPASPSLSSWEPPAEMPSASRQEQGQGQGQQRDELQELTEQFNKVADTGKRMFGNFLSKAKEQMNRLDDAIVRSASPPSTSSPSTSAAAPAPPPKPVPARTSSTSSWTAPSPLPRPPPPRNLSSDGPPPVVMIDRTGLAGVGGEEKKDEPAAASAGGLAAPGSGPSIDSPKKDFSSKIPGLLPRQSFSLLDTKAGPKSPSAEDKGAPTSTSTSTSSTGTGAAGSGAMPAAAGLAAGAGAGAGLGAAGGAAAAGGGGAPMASPLSAPNHALGDDDDESDDDLEYTRSPFDDD
ncbi:hypothetical protein JCM8208_002340 [Rhodotorula glutinis]